MKYTKEQIEAIIVWPNNAEFDVSRSSWLDWIKCAQVTLRDLFYSLEAVEQHLEIEKACNSELMSENIMLKKQLEVAVSALEDFKVNGFKADLNPTQPMDDWEKVTHFFLCYLRGIDSSVSYRARQSLDEIKELG